MSHLSLDVKLFVYDTKIQEPATALVRVSKNVFLKISQAQIETM